jgi:hypothetical protein
LQKMEKMKISVASALSPFLAWIVSDLNSETCVEISKVVFRRWSVVRILIWAREALHFPLWSFCPVCARAPSRTCTLRHSPTHMHACLIFFCSSLLFFFSVTIVCAPTLPRSLYRLTAQHSWRPRSMVTPQLCSSCWRRGLTMMRRLW